MKVPVSWLREYVEVSATTQQMADRLAIATGEVERITRRGIADENGNYGHFKVGRVLEAGKHPNADRLQLCRVDVGEPEPRQIVCGAWNFGAGATVAVALPGAVLPDGNRLEQANLRGEVSDGMILSEQELDLGTDHAGILVLSDPFEPGTPLADVLPLGEEVLEIEMTRNRPDCLSVYGIAREVAALFSGELKPPPGRDPGSPGAETPDITIEDYEGCPRYIGRLFRNVGIAASPPWLKARITAAGMRPISNVVDVTNYVMLALGNPLHAFDFDTLRGAKIVVRRAKKGEEFTTLDGTPRTLDPDDLVIADAEGAIAFAGIMGGEETEVREQTKNVLLEAANFEPVGILRSSERHALRTEGSNRWEKGVDPYLAPQAAALATELIVELAGAEWAGDTDAVGQLPERPVVSLRTDRVNRTVGLEIAPEEQRGALERLGFGVGDDWSVTVPTWRAIDVNREIDLVEEVARVNGLEKIPFTLPLRSAMFGRLAPDQRLRRLVEDVLVGVGFSEAYTLSLTSSDRDETALRLPDPLTSEHAVLRTTLLSGLIAAARHNMNMANEGIRLFEIARVYLPGKDELPQERRRVGAIAEGGFAVARGAVETLFAALKIEPRLERAEEPFLHPGKAARVQSGWVGELHPTLLEGEWGVFELDLETLLELLPERLVYEDVITFPALRQDLAFVVGEDVAAGDLVAAAKEAGGPELRDLTVFDVYRGEGIGDGKKSIAFHAEFRSPERTLSDDDARILREKIVAALGAQFAAELRA
ncbi:MAG TPA: phenylalanine--tRNA ligase subunit beta [Gaiellaceae bacterium]|jgi:phenylalanyl-tRNA synthetase beta chain|nr:phenylalanine--tRNA ligase subunit beta [Gaiellaceae bacterium]